MSRAPITAKGAKIYMIDTVLNPANALPANATTTTSPTETTATTTAETPTTTATPATTPETPATTPETPTASDTATATPAA